MFRAVSFPFSLFHEPKSAESSAVVNSHAVNSEGGFRGLRRWDLPAVFRFCRFSVRYSCFGTLGKQICKFFCTLWLDKLLARLLFCVFFFYILKLTNYLFFVLEDCSFSHCIWRNMRFHQMQFVELRIQFRYLAHRHFT